MFGSKRSGIPVAGATKSGIPTPTVRKSTGQSTTTTQARSSKNGTRSGIPALGTGGDKTTASPGGKSRLLGPSNQGIKKKVGAGDLPNDTKILKEQVLDLRKQVLGKDEALTELSQKYARISEECDDLVEERDTIRRRNSLDLQQVTKDYVELQENIKQQQRYIADMEKSHTEEKEHYTLEFDILKGENEMEISMLKKELLDLRMKSDRKKPQLDMEDDASDTLSRDHSPAIEAMQEQMASLQANYEEEVQTVKEQLQNQIQKTNDVVEKIEQQEFEFHENLNELKNKFNMEQELNGEEHRTELANLRSTYEERLKYQEERHQGKMSSDVSSPRDTGKELVIDALREEHQAYVEALKEQYGADLEQLKEDLKEKNAEVILKENQMAEDLLMMQNEYESQLNGLRSDLEKSKAELGRVASDTTIVEQLKEEHIEEMDELRAQQRKLTEELKTAVQERESGDESNTSKGSLESELRQKEQLQAYEHEIRNMKVEVKKERQDFAETRELLESTITDLESNIKEREERIRRELYEEHQFSIEMINTNHEKVLHENGKSYRQEIAKLKQEHEESLAQVVESNSRLGSQETITKTEEEVEDKISIALSKLKEEHLKEIDSLRLEHEREIENLQETLENVQMENEELQTEYDLVVNDLNSELETTKLEVRGDKRRHSGVLKEQIEKLKDNKEEQVHHLVQELRGCRTKIGELENEVDDLKRQGKQEELGTDYIEKVTELERLVETLEAEKSNADVLAEYKAECEILQDEVNQYKRLGDEDRRRADENDMIASKIQENLNQLAQDKERESAEFTKRFSELGDEMQRIKEERDDELEGMKTKTNLLQCERDNIRTQGQQELDEQKLCCEEKVLELRNIIKELEEVNQRTEQENEQLRDDMEEMRNIQKLESDIVAEERFMISEENIDMIGEDTPGTKEELESDQKMKGMVEEFENRITDLQTQLERTNQQLASKNKRMESVNAEMNVLRENLENERSLVQNLEDRLQSLLRKHEGEVKQLKQKYEENEESRSTMSFRASQVEQEYTVTIKHLKEDLSLALGANGKQTEQISELKEQLARFEQEQIEHEANYVAEQLKKVEADKQIILNLENELRLKSEQATELISTLEIERSEHAQKVKDFDFMVEQLKEKDANGEKIQDLVNKVQKQKEKVVILSSTLETERNEHAERVKQLEKGQHTKETEIRSLTSMVDSERSGHAQKLDQLEQELDKKSNEIKTLGSMLETEQASHEKTLNETQKHFARLDDVEKEKLSLKKEAAQMKSKHRELKAELAHQHEQNTELLSRSQKMTMDEIEEVQKLNRSLTEAEVDKGKLLGEVESSKQVLQRTQEKYNKVKEKFTKVKKKWHEDHTKLEGILLSPRVDMGLQTSIIEMSDLEDANNRLSQAVTENSKLEEELRDSKEDAQRRKNDMQALKRANNVLIKQNQVLYLETESLKQTIEELSRKSDQLREMSIQLTKENENVDLENKDMKEILNRMEEELTRTEVERSSIDALNESSKSEVEEVRNTQDKLKEENDRFKNQNDFLLSQGKRLQSRVDELEGELKDLRSRTSLLVSVEENIIKTGSQLVLESAPGNDVQRFAEENKVMQQNLERMQGLLNNKESELLQSETEKRAVIDGFGKERRELLSQIQTLNERVGNTPSGDKRYVGIKSFQVIEWGTNQKLNTEDEPKRESTPSTTSNVSRNPFDGLQVAKVKELDFDCSNYLGSAYWDAMNYLKTTKSPE